jgi:hypothetical protein
MDLAGGRVESVPWQFWDSELTEVPCMRSAGKSERQDTSSEEGALTALLSNGAGSQMSRSLVS